MAASTYGFTWYDVSPAERSRQRLSRPPWWIKVSDTYYRTTTMVPALFHERLDEFGIDFSLVYPGYHRLSAHALSFHYQCFLVAFHLD